MKIVQKFSWYTFQLNKQNFRRENWKTNCKQDNLYILYDVNINNMTQRISKCFL